MGDPFGSFHRLHKHVFDSFRPWNHLNVNNLCNLNKHKKYFDHLRPLSAYVICESSCTDRTSCISSKKYQDIFVFWYNSWAQVRAVTNLDVTCGSVLLENRSWNIHFWVVINSNLKRYLMSKLNAAYTPDNLRTRQKISHT